MCYGTCHTLPPAVRLSSWIPCLPSLCCTESEDSSDSNSENLYQQQPVFISSLRVFSLVFDVLHTVINSVCVCANLANRASHTSSNRLFSRGHDPFAHACEARPLTIVGWTSLSVSLSLSMSKKRNMHRSHNFCVASRVRQINNQCGGKCESLVLRSLQSYVECSNRRKRARNEASRGFLFRGSNSRSSRAR